MGNDVRRIAWDHEERSIDHDLRLRKTSKEGILSGVSNHSTRSWVGANGLPVLAHASGWGQGESVE